VLKTNEEEAGRRLHGIQQENNLLQEYMAEEGGRCRKEEVPGGKGRKRDSGRGIGRCRTGARDEKREAEGRAVGICDLWRE